MVKSIRVIYVCLLFLACSVEVFAQYIPGLTAVDVHGNLTNKGFSLNKNLKPGNVYWECKNQNSEHLYHVFIYGDNASNIFQVKATVLNYSSKSTESLAKDFLGFIATIPYTGSKPNEAKNWVISNINKSCTTSIAGVTYEIVANPSSPLCRILIIYTRQ